MFPGDTGPFVWFGRFMAVAILLAAPRMTTAEFATVRVAAGAEYHGRGVASSVTDGYAAVLDATNAGTKPTIKTYTHPTERYTVSYGDPWLVDDPGVPQVGPAVVTFRTCDHLLHGGVLPQGCAQMVLTPSFPPDGNEFKFALRALQHDENVKISPVEKPPLRITETFSFYGEDETYNRTTLFVRRSEKLLAFTLDYRVTDPNASAYERALDYMASSLSFQEAQLGVDSTP